MTDADGSGATALHAPPPGQVWIFGYGSLIWRPGFDYLERRRARLHGWQRRFWQGSHDHRGMPQRPGRVVTLVPAAEGHCDGVAYRVDRATLQAVFEALDHREKNGYRRFDVVLEHPATPAHGAGTISPARRFPSVAYIAPADNFAYLGPAPLSDMVRQIVASRGPSGANLEYLLRLAEALRRIDADDAHVFELEEAARSIRS